jgi:signal transduction histidine kinase
MRKIFALIFFWLLFVISLTGWWLYFGLKILSQVVESQPQILKHQRMLFMEGCALIVFLFFGGMALFYLSYRMYQEKMAKEIFFASFTHDLKTALFRIQLEVEKLGKKLNGSETENILVQTRKMQIDLENSLDSIVGGRKVIFLEKISLQNIMEELHTQWPEFRVKLTGDKELFSDRKAIFSILKNLLHNSFVHGKADEINISLRNEKSKSYLLYSDNGSEFVGNLQNLGMIYPNKTGSSGFGLYISRQWVVRLGGKINFLPSENRSLIIRIELPWDGQ